MNHTNNTNTKQWYAILDESDKVLEVIELQPNLCIGTKRSVRLFDNEQKMLNHLIDTRSDQALKKYQELQTLLEKEN